MISLYRQKLGFASLWQAPGLRLLMLSVVIAVAAMTAVGLFADRVEKSLTRQGASMLAADLVVQQGRPIPQAWKDRAAEEGLQQAEILMFPSVLFYQDEPHLVQVKAVNNAYPLRGELAVEQANATSSKGPLPGHAFIESRLMSRLTAELGETEIPFGEKQLKVDGIIHLEPDRGGNLFQLAPRLMVNMQDVLESGLLGPASRVRYRLLLTGSESALQSYRSWLESEMPAQTRIMDVDNARPEFKAALDRGRRFLSLAALCASLLAGVAIMLATRRHVALVLDTAAVMRTLGFSGKQVLWLHLFELIWATLLAVVVGLILAWLAQSLLVSFVASFFSNELPSPGLRPLMMGLFYGLLLVVGFSLPSLLAIRHVPPLRVLRRELNPPSLSNGLIWLIAASAFSGLIYWQVQDAELAAVMIIGLLASFALLMGLAYGLLKLLQVAVIRGKGSGFGLNALVRQPGLTVLQLTGYGFALTVLLLLSLVRVDLLEVWQDTLPEKTPNHFLINIQPEEKAGLEQRLENEGISGSGMYATTRGRLTHINEREIKPDAFDTRRARRLAAREYSLGFAQNKQTDNRILLGEWWDEEAAQKPGFSVEQGVAKELNMRIGDVLRLDVAGIEISGPVTSVRSVAWDSFNVNFFITATPYLMQEIPVAYISSIRIEEGQDAVVRQVVRDYPAVNVIDLRPLLEQVRAVIEQGASAIESVFIFTLLAAVMVTLAAIQISRDQRAQEIAVLRTLGASRQLVRKAVMVEFGLMGLLSGLVAAILASFINAVLAARLFDLGSHINPSVWLVGCLAGVIGVSVVGLLATRGLLKTPPVRVLQSI